MITSEVWAQSEPKVFVTKTGAKYHRSSCRYAQTGWEATLTEAKERKLTACLVCKPGGGSATIPANSSSTQKNSLYLQNPVKLTPASRRKLTPSGRSKLTPASRSKLTPLEEYFLGME